MDENRRKFLVFEKLTCMEKLMAKRRDYMEKMTMPLLITYTI